VATSPPEVGIGGSSNCGYGPFGNAGSETTCVKFLSSLMKACQNFWKRLTSSAPGNCCCYYQGGLFTDDACKGALDKGFTTTGRSCTFAATTQPTTGSGSDSGGGNDGSGQGSKNGIGCFGISTFCSGKDIKECSTTGGRREVTRLSTGIVGSVKCVYDRGEALCLTGDHYVRHKSKWKTMDELCMTETCETRYEQLTNYYTAEHTEEFACAGYTVGQWSGKLGRLMLSSESVRKPFWPSLGFLNA
jgi:hypothetical protein